MFYCTNLSFNKKTKYSFFMNFCKMDFFLIFHLLSIKLENKKVIYFSWNTSELSILNHLFLRTCTKICNHNIFYVFFISLNIFARFLILYFIVSYDITLDSYIFYWKSWLNCETVFVGFSQVLFFPYVLARNSLHRCLNQIFIFLLFIFNVKVFIINLKKTFV